MQYLPERCNFVDQTQWRWNRVKYLVNNGLQPSPPGDDLAVHTAYSFYLEIKEASGDYEKEREVALRHPFLYEAFILQWGSDGTVVDAVRSQITAKQPMKKIAGDYGCHPRVIEWFRALWYDVQEDATRHFIMNVLAPEVHKSGFSSDDTHAYFTLVGGFGADVLDDILTKRPISEKTAQGHHDMTRSLTWYNATKASATMPINGYTANAVLESFLQMDKLDKDVESDTAERGTVADLMSYMLSGLSWAIADSNAIPKSVHDPNVQKAIEAGNG